MLLPKREKIYWENKTNQYDGCQNMKYQLTPCGWPPDYSFKTKVIQCKHCIKRGDPIRCPMCSDELIDDDWIIRDRTTDNGFCHLGEQEKLF